VTEQIAGQSPSTSKTRTHRDRVRFPPPRGRRTEDASRREPGVSRDDWRLWGHPDSPALPSLAAARGADARTCRASGGFPCDRATILPESRPISQQKEPSHPRRITGAAPPRAGASQTGADRTRSRCRAGFVVGIAPRAPCDRAPAVVPRTGCDPPRGPSGPPREPPPVPSHHQLHAANVRSGFPWSTPAASGYPGPRPRTRRHERNA